MHLHLPFQPAGSASKDQRLWESFFGPFGFGISDLGFRALGLGFWMYHTGHHGSSVVIDGIRVYKTYCVLLCVIHWYYLLRCITVYCYVFLSTFFIM